MLFFFFFQAEDGIRDLTVTGVQTCALPILCRGAQNTTQWANELAAGKKQLEERGRRSGRKESARRQGIEVRSVPKHAEFSSWREPFHAATVIFGGERSWISAAVSRSMTFIGPPHLGQR